MKYSTVSGKRFNRWPSIYFLGGISLITVIGCPLYVFFYSISLSGLFIFLGMSIATLLSITAGYHRLYSHKTYKACLPYHFLCLGFGAASLQQSALKWSSLHRSHHQNTDSLNDPYNIKKGFFYAHVGWILFWLRKINLKNVKDLKQNKLLMHQNKYYQSWALAFGVIIPLVLGILTNEIIEALLFGVVARLFCVFQATFFINSFAHVFGKQTYNEENSARDNWFGAFLTFGEGYHSFHHRFSVDYRNGHRWFHWDPSKWFIYGSSMAGLTWDLKRTPSEKIEAVLVS